LLLEGIYPPDLASRQAAIESALNPIGNGQYATEYRIVGRNDRVTRWVSVIGQVFFENAQPQRMVGVVRDITAQKEAEQKIQQQRREMESLLKHQVAVQTASAIAHELNQPLVAISAYSESALRMLENGTSHAADLLHALQGSVDQAQRAGKTVHELLAFLQGGQTESAPMYLNARIREAIATLQRDGYGEFLPILELEKDLPPVQGNRTQVQKVLDNLLRNSVEAMRAARVPTSAMSIRVRTTASAGMAQVSVQDSGPGIGAELARRIFEPFYTTKSNGIGMGLAISRSLIETLGGRLWVDADAVAGTTFHFTLPLAA
jgi:C4-dicarboxylate-specific signal transduction histidine kinase